MNISTINLNLETEIVEVYEQVWKGDNFAMVAKQASGIRMLL